MMARNNVRFERLFDDWENESDLAMVDLTNTITKPSPTSPRELQHSGDDENAPAFAEHRGNDDGVPPIPPPLTPFSDDASARSFLHSKRLCNSDAKTSDYEAVGGQIDDVEATPGHRIGFRAGVRRMWSGKTGLSQRTATTFDGKFAHGRPGLWKKQMLVDRSLRGMAAVTALCALIMMIIVLSYINDFAQRLNKNTTSVGGRAGESCRTSERRNVAVHLFINIAATIILGCSNTYQQLVTALKVDEVRWILSKRGDSKVGTNSPWAINHKRDGKLKAWLAWTLLICTSIPVHFLANSVIGPSFYIHMPKNVTYSVSPGAFAPSWAPSYYVDSNPNSTTGGGSQSSNSSYQNLITPPVDASISPDDSACWTAFRSGIYVLPTDISQLSNTFNSSILGNSTTFASVLVMYTANCSQLKGTASTQTALTEFRPSGSGSQVTIQYQQQSCAMGPNVICILNSPQPQECRINVRMQAALILMACLLIKAGYMVAHNFRARRRTKEHLLTFGDVIVASVLDPELKVKNECMLNSGDGWRTEVAHTCHTHCKDPIPSRTGDSIGHCQMCKKFNKTNKSADLPHPSIAIKYKRSLLSNLGSNAITQMITLLLCSLGLLAGSLMLIVLMVSDIQQYHATCVNGLTRPNNPDVFDCSISASQYLKMNYGTWGGFSSSAMLGSFNADSLGSEFLAFSLSNGSQFLYSLLYLLLIYNITLISMENDWGNWETTRKRPRCTLVSGRPFEQSYFLQLPSRVLVPMMAYAALMHWLLGEALSATETIYTDPVNGVEHSIYFITYAAYPIFITTILMILMTSICWWAFTYRREGFVPQMYGSIRACCASTSDLVDFNTDGIQWGDLGKGEKFRHAGFSSDEPQPIIPGELYCGRDPAPVNP